MKKIIFALVMLLILGLMTCQGSNEKPVINGVTAEKSNCFSGEEIQITVDAMDADGDTLTYKWLAELGEVIDKTDNTCIWKAPAQAGTVNIENCCRQCHYHCDIEKWDH